MNQIINEKQKQKQNFLTILKTSVVDPKADRGQILIILPDPDRYHFQTNEKVDN
jgi:hypothetical protein